MALVDSEGNTARYYGAWGIIHHVPVHCETLESLEGDPTVATVHLCCPYGTGIL